MIPIPREIPTLETIQDLRHAVRRIVNRCPSNGEEAVWLAEHLEIVEGQRERYPIAIAVRDDDLEVYHGYLEIGSEYVSLSDVGNESGVFADEFASPAMLVGAYLYIYGVYHTQNDVRQEARWKQQEMRELQATNYSDYAEYVAWRDAR